MITQEEFEMEFGGHGTAYSSFMLIDVTEEQVLTALNLLEHELSRSIVGSGREEEYRSPDDVWHRAVHFEVERIDPSFVHELTAELHCKGVADMGSWYGSVCFEVSRDGSEDLSFVKAFWEDGCPLPADNDLYDATFIIQDKETGATFPTGEGAVDMEEVERFQSFINLCNMDPTHNR